MIKTPRYSYQMMELGDIWYPKHDRENMNTVENQFDALIKFVGPGVIDGWDVTKMNITGDDDLDLIYRAEQLALIDAYDNDPYSRLGKQFYALNLVSTIDHCKVASVSNLTLSGLQKIDGVDVLAGDRILVKNQTSQADNGVYVAASGSWARATDFDSSSDLVENMVVRVLNGSDNEDTLWALSPPELASSTPYTYVLGTDDLFFHDAWEQVARVTPGNGFVGKWAARTETPAYFRFTSSDVYYVWVQAGNCLITEGLATVVAPIEPDIEYDNTHTATFLAEVWVSQKNNTGSDGDFRIYIDKIVYSDKRQILKNLASALNKALQKAFYRHVHLGGSNHPSKINLSTSKLLTAFGPQGSTIFILNDENGNQFTWNESEYGIPVVKLNDSVLSETLYVINSTQGKLYLQNSISSGSSLIVNLPLAKQTKLTIQSDSDIVDSFIYLTDGSVRLDANGNSDGTAIYTWDEGLHHEPVVKLSGEIVDINTIPYVVDSSRGGISFNPALTGYSDDDLEVIITHIGDEIVGNLSGARISNIDASSFTSGKLDTRRMFGLSHVGQNRYMEPAEIRPTLRLFDSGDHTVFYTEVPNSELQHNSDIYTLYTSKNFSSKNILIGAKHAFLQTSDYVEAASQPFWVQDNGQVVQIIDNMLPVKNENHFANTYIRTWDDSLTPKTGKIFVTQDGGLSWQKLKMPVIASESSNITALATSLQVSTDKVEVTNGLIKTNEWYTIYNLGTDRGMYSASVKEGLTDNEWEWVYQSYVPINSKVHSVLELVTTRQSWDNDGNLTETFDRSVYVGADNGFFVNGFLVSDDIVKGIYWLNNGSDPRKNNIIWHTDHEVFITHTAELIETSGARYYNHPLAYFQQADIVELVNAKAATTSNIYNFTNECPSVVDGVALSVNDRVLVKNQNNKIENGIYKVVTVGTGADGEWVRADDMLAAASITPEFKVNVSFGNINGSSSWNVKEDAVVGTDYIIWNNLILRPIVDTSRTFVGLHQHAYDPSIYFALTNTNIYRIDDVYNEYSFNWVSLSASQMVWDEVYQGSPRCITSDSLGDYGTIYIGSNKGVWKSANPLWDSSNTNAPWVRTSQQFLKLHEPNAYNSLDLTEFYNSSEFTTILPAPTLQHNVAHQSFVFDSAQDIWKNFVYEKDYTTFWVNPWIANNSDVIVYIGDNPSEIEYSLEPSEGKIQFISSVGRDYVNKVKITILRPNAFISDVGTTPHGEMPNSFVTESTEATLLSQDFTAQDSIVYVSDENAIPVGTDYIELRNSISRERLNISVHPETKQITLVYPRSGVTTFPKTVTKVYIVSTMSVLGIEDKITKHQSNQTYHLNSLGGANTIQLSIASKESFTSPSSGYFSSTKLFDNFGSYPKSNTIADRGPKNAMFFDFSSDAYDSAQSSSTFYIGNEPSGGIDTAIEPTSVYSIYNATDTGNQMRIGTDQGVWRYSSSDSRWIKESDIGSATKTYFIQNVDSNLTVGSNYGAYQKDSGTTWSLNSVYPQTIFAQLDNQAWKTSGGVTYTYDAWGKDDGLAFVLKPDNGDDFISDHFDALDGRRVYGLYHDQFIRVGTDSNGETTQTKTNALYLATEDGVYAVTDGGRSSSFSSVLVGRQMFGDNKPSVQILLPDNSTQLVPVKFYKITKPSRENSIPLILLSNNGVYIVRNWRWCDPNSSARPPVLDFEIESHSLVGISCYCYLHATEGTDPTVYKIFIGTEKGVYRSYDGGYNWERCERIAGGDTSVNTLVFSGDGILAGTELGLFYSDDDGDTWYQPSNNGNGVAEYDSKISTSIPFNGGYLAQTFVLDDISTEIEKISVLLSLKDLTTAAEYEASLNNTLEISIFTTSTGTPNAVVAPVSPQDVILAQDMIYQGWKAANINVTGLTPDATYALVIKENIAPGGVSIFRWHTSKISNPYSNGQAFSGGLVPTWSALTNQDFYFRIYQSAPPTATETIEPVGFYDDTYDTGWWSGEGRGWVVNDDGALTSNINPLISIVVDDSRSCKWNDPSLSNPRELAIPDLLTSLFEINDIALSGDLFPELNGEIYYPSFADFWVFGNGILERTSGFTNDLTESLQVVSAALYERGLISEPYDAANIAFGSLVQQSIFDSIIKPNDDDANIERMKKVVEYMNDLNLLRHDDIVDYWSNLSSSEQSEWGTTGGELDENIPFYSDVSNFVLQRFSMLFVPLALLISDGNGDGNPSDVALTLLSNWDENGIQPKIVGLGESHKHQNLRTLADDSFGQHIVISDGNDWDDFKDSLYPLENNTIYKANWTRKYDFYTPTYINKIVANGTSGVNADFSVSYRYTLDRINWTSWATHGGGEEILGLKILGIEYKVELIEGIDAGEKTLSEITELYHTVISPGYKYLFTLPQTIDGMMFEYLLSADVGSELFDFGFMPIPVLDAEDSEWSKSADIKWGIVRGDSVDFADYERIRKNRKGALPNRQSSLQFTDEIVQDKLDTVTEDFKFYYVKDDLGDTVTWSTSDVVTAYALILGEYREVVPDGIDGDFGFVYFATEQPTDLIIKVTILTPQQLYSLNGEATSTSDGRTYTLVNGSWPKDATPIVLVNGKITRGGYWISADNGTVTFAKERERTDIVTVYIQFDKTFRVGVEIKNYSTTDIVPSNFGLYYTVKKDGRLVQLYQDTPPPSIVNNLVQILPNGYNEPTSSQRLIIDYEFNSTDSNTERGTKTTWWRKRPSDPATYSLPEDPDYPGQNFQQMTYENIETVGMVNRNFPEYNDRTVERKVDVGDGDWFKSSDIIRVKVTPSDGINEGDTISSSATTLVGDNIPYVSGVSILATGKVEDPPSSGDYYVPAGTELRARYSYTDGTTVVIDGAEHTCLVEWFINDSSSVYSTLPRIPSGATSPGQSINFRVTPRDGVMPNSHIGIPVTSDTIFIR
jgi:hypothetical protein